MTAQTFTKPVITIPRQPQPPVPRYEGLFLEPAYADLSDTDGTDEDDYEDAA